MALSKANSRHRSFSAPAKPETETVELEPVTFDIDGVDFTAKNEIQGIVLLDFLEASDGEAVSSVVAFKKFLKDSMEDEEYTRFDNFLRTHTRKIELEEIANVVAYLVEEYTSRPTQASEQ